MHGFNLCNIDQENESIFLLYFAKKIQIRWTKQINIMRYCFFN